MTEPLARYGLFSGCAVEHAGSPTRHATSALARALGIEFWEAPARGCCGARMDRPTDDAALRHLLAPLVEATNQELAILCLSPGCRQVIASHLPTIGYGTPATDTGTAQSPRTCDLLQLLAQEDVLARLVGSLTTRLAPLRVALHGSCHGDHIPAPALVQQPLNLSSTPGAENKASGPAQPRGSSPPDKGLADLIAMTGAEPLEEVSVAGRCTETPLLPMLANHQADAPACLALAARAGVDAMVTPCFLCFGALNERQRQLNRNDPIRSVPVLHMAQMLGMACGVAPLRLDLGHLAASARRVLAPFVI
jgi:heterodisulfide reductase subunit B